MTMVDHEAALEWATEWCQYYPVESGMGNLAAAYIELNNRLAQNVEACKEFAAGQEQLAKSAGIPLSGVTVNGMDKPGETGLTPASPANLEPVAEVVSVADIESEIAHIKQNGIDLAKFGGENIDEGRCRELCAMYLQEFIISKRMQDKLSVLIGSL